MATQVQNRRGTTAEHSTFTGAVGEVTIDTDKDTAVVHDGSTAGGRALLREDGTNSALALGSAGTPSLKFTGDPNTGIYSPGADQVAISTNGTGRLFINSSGQVGVGTSSPSQQLHVTSAGNTTALIAGGGTGFAQLKLTGGSTENYIDSDDPLQLSIGGTTRATLTSTGLGVGTTSPSTDLHVSKAASTEIRVSGTANGSSATIGVYGTPSGGGSRDISLKYDSSSDTYKLITTTGNDITIGNSAGEAMRIDGSRRVGIGTSSPGAKLHSVETSAAEGLRIDGASGGFSLVVEGGTTRVTRAKQATIGNSYVGNTPPTDGLIVQGSVGIGNTNPGDYYNSQLVVGNTSTTNTGLTLSSSTSGTSRILFADGDSGADRYRAAIQYGHSTDQFDFRNAGDQLRMSIDSSGRLLVGTSTSFDQSARLQVIADTGTSVAANFYSFGADNSQFVIGAARGTVASPTTLNSTDTIGGVYFRGHDGTSFKTGAQILAQIDGITPGSDLPSRLVFSTTADGASSPTERMRIDSSGRVLIGTAASFNIWNTSLETGGNVRLSGVLSGGRTGGDYDGIGYNVGWQQSSGHKYVVSDTAAFIKFGGNGGRIETYTAAGGLAGNSISFSTGPYVAQGGTSWTSSSDERLKEDLLPIEDGLTKVGSLRAVTGRFKTDDASKRRSFLLAQDVHNVLPEAVDTVDPESLGLDYVAVIPLLVAALKESKERIETLEAEVAALKAP